MAKNIQSVIEISPYKFAYLLFPYQTSSPTTGLPTRLWKRKSLDSSVRFCVFFWRLPIYVSVTISLSCSECMLICLALLLCSFAFENDRTVIYESQLLIEF